MTHHCTLGRLTHAVSAALLLNCGIAQLVPADTWLKDATTLVLKKPSEKKGLRNSFNGLRLIFEPQLGILIQDGADRFKADQLRSLERFGFETNLVSGDIAFHAMFIPPSFIEFEIGSPLLTNGNVIDPKGKVRVDYGVAFGLSFLDSMFALGFGGIFYDQRDFQNTAGKKGEFQDNFWYVNFQPISAIKAYLKSRKT